MSKHARPKYRKGQPPKPANRHANQPATQAHAKPVAQRPAPQAAPSSVVTLAPLAPVIVRSGRPFDAQAGVDPARLPPPSTIAGCLRSAWARQTGEPYGTQLASLTVAGPLLVREGSDGPHSVLVPRPADALYFGTGIGARLRRAGPAPLAADEGTDLPAGLAPVRLTDPDAGRAKPGPGPAWWSLTDLLAWRRGEPLTHAQVSQHGWSPADGEVRTHVAIATATQAADPGRLFQTQGLDLGAGIERAGERKGKERPALRLLARCAEPLTAALVHLGGERRLAALATEEPALWPAAPQDWSRDIRTAGGLTLTLVTPAPFTGGWRPGWLADDLTGTPPGGDGLRLQLLAVASGPWEPHSGWDLARQQPRPARRLVPAGATYWFRLLDCPDPTALDALWLASLCDVEQDRRDGFGLALPAPWTPTLTARPGA